MLNEKNQIKLFRHPRAYCTIFQNRTTGLYTVKLPDALAVASVNEMNVALF